tara:strand:+ start:379 stop:624 length:246 start_codon:yes stop_codon:yes gene_type:complete
MKEYNQVEAHKQWDKQIQDAIEEIDLVQTLLIMVKSEANVNGLDYKNLPEDLDHIADKLNEFQDKLEPIFLGVGTVYKRGA